MNGNMQAPNVQADNKAKATTQVSVIVWRDYLIQRRRSLRTELAEIENILQRIAEQGIDKAPG